MTNRSTFLFHTGGGGLYLQGAYSFRACPLPSPTLLFGLHSVRFLLALLILLLPCFFGLTTIFFSRVFLLGLCTLCFSFFLSIFPSTCAGDYLLAPGTFCTPVCGPCQLEGAGSLKLTLQRVPDTFAGPLSRCTCARCLEGSRRGSHITQGS